MVEYHEDPVNIDRKYRLKIKRGKKTGKRRFEYGARTGRRTSVDRIEKYNFDQQKLKKKKTLMQVYQF